MHKDVSNEVAAGEADDTAGLPDRSLVAEEMGDHAGVVLTHAMARRPQRPVRVDPWDEYRVGGDLVIEEQPMTAIYENTVGAIVVRQLDAEGDTDNDPVVRFLPHYAPTVIRKIAELAGYHVLWAVAT
jgi:hypothetical protein